MSYVSKFVKDFRTYPVCYFCDRLIYGRPQIIMVKPSEYVKRRRVKVHSRCLREQHGR